MVGCPEREYAEALSLLSRFRSGAYDSKTLRKQFIDIATQ